MWMGGGRDESQRWRHHVINMFALDTTATNVNMVSSFTFVGMVMMVAIVTAMRV
jgi:hypothetical protein